MSKSKDGKRKQSSMPTTATSSKDASMSQLPSSANGDLQLLCLIRGQSIVFPITAPRNCLVANLKELVHVKGFERSSDTLAKDLVLWKVAFNAFCYILRLTSPPSQVDIYLNTHTKDSLSRFDVKEDDKGVQKLTEWELVSDYWSTQPANGRLQVFVNLPASGELKLVIPVCTNSTNNVTAPSPPSFVQSAIRSLLRSLT
jgi:hypothetical protein